MRIRLSDRTIMFFLFLGCSSILFGQWNTDGNFVELQTTTNRVQISDVNTNTNFGKFFVRGSPFQSGAQTLVNIISTVDMLTPYSLLELRGDAASGNNPIFIKGVDDAQNPKFQIWLDGDAEFDGELNLRAQTTSGDVALRIKSDQAIWYNGDYFSWGFGGNRHRFADPITIGSDIAPAPGFGLRIDGDDGMLISGDGNIQMFGDGNLIMDGDGGLCLRGIGDLTFRSNPGNSIIWLDDSQNLKTELANGPEGLDITAFEGLQMVVPGQAVIDLDSGIRFVGESQTAYLNNGGFGIGIAEPEHVLHVDGDVGITGQFFALSDQRVKKNIIPLQGQLENILDLRPSTFDWRDKVDRVSSIGLIAQEVESLFPELVHTSEIGNKMVNYQILSVLAIQGLKEQQVLIKNLEEKLESLITRLNHIEQFKG